MKIEADITKSAVRSKYSVAQSTGH